LEKEVISLKIKTNIRAGQQNSAGTPQDYAKAVIDGLVDTFQGETRNLKLWSIVRLKGDGISNWLITQQTPVKPA